MTFKELPIHAQFKVPNATQIIRERGDRPLPVYYGLDCIFIKRDALGGHVIYFDEHDRWHPQQSSVYYRIEPDNEVETW